MKNAKQNSSINNKQHKKIESTKIETPSKLHDDQLSIVLAFFANPNPSSPSSIRSLHHLDTHLASIHTKKRKHNFLSHFLA
jgi:hypothetical protein